MVVMLYVQRLFERYNKSKSAKILLKILEILYYQMHIMIPAMSIMSK